MLCDVAGARSAGTSSVTTQAKQANTTTFHSAVASVRRVPAEAPFCKMIENICSNVKSVHEHQFVCKHSFA